MEPESRQTHVLVAEDQLSLAIGKEGQNISRPPTGWKIDIKDRAKYDYQAEDSKFATVAAQYQAQETEAMEDEEEYEAEDEVVEATDALA